jgi:hypothetical protein
LEHNGSKSWGIFVKKKLGFLMLILNRVVIYGILILVLIGFSENTKRAKKKN